ncbi:hypothetical protein ACH5RR_017046 [Cinchona calisaya]|uniref:Putative plant transposon protein domain-containing protein n=1 Tax=Cinchona calisaya TaxID=153742 RepID=A0ABD3A0D2_9GENT
MARHFNANTLKPTWLVWFKFLCTRLLPINHLAHVTLESAKLLHYIATGRSIDVGQLLHQQICYSATNKQPNLWFSHLITALCLKSGVLIDLSEEKFKPGKLIAMEGMRASIRRTRSHPSTSQVDETTDSEDEAVPVPQHTQEEFYSKSWRDNNR